MSQARVRVFAGPNGSGKSTLNEVLPPKLLGYYINADQILVQLKQNSKIELSHYGLNADRQRVMEFLNRHPLSDRASLKFHCHFKDNTLYSSNPSSCNAYHAAVIADLLRHELLRQKSSFTFETVMSSKDKILFLKKAKEAGYRVYLYFIATVDPLININRVNIRVSAGGHDVPKDKIIARYYRSIKLLAEALPLTDRAYLFDNSGSERVWIAEITDGKEVEIRSNSIPHWVGSLFKIDKPIKKT